VPIASAINALATKKEEKAKEKVKEKANEKAKA